ncbi:MAG: flagellar hook protein FlgE [Halochromatium sp.]|nr:flagellar hook protein FlgE [Halochromatium sp.]
MSFSQALSGLSAQSENLKVISNNIANSQTVGYKNGRIAFADIFAGASQVGIGAQVASITQDFRSGDLEITGRNLDLAIAGGGFYRLEDAKGDTVFSRNGQFNQDANGYLVNASGQRLTGYAMNADDETFPFAPVIPGGAPQPLQIPPNDIPANATTLVETTYNLDASAVPGQDLQTASIDTGGGVSADINFHFSTSYTVFDSLGNERTVTTYYEKNTNPADGESLWGATVVLDGARPGWTPPVVNPGSGNYDFELNFDANGQLDVNGVTGAGAAIITGTASGAAAVTGAPATVNPPFSRQEGQLRLSFANGTFDLEGAATLEFDVNLAGTTQFNNNSVQNTMSQDGYSSGTLAGLEVLEDGTVMRIFTNDERRPAGQIALANFANPEGLMPDGNNGWTQSDISGEAVLGTAGTGVLGTIRAETLESSNVDLASELVNMIISQRAYQANSTSIGTQDELLQTVINL